MNWMHHSVIAVALICSVASTSSYSGVVIVGLDKAQSYQGSSATEYFIQAGAFAVENNAIQYRRALRSKTSVPVNIDTRGRLHVVFIGPLRSAADVRSTAAALNTTNTRFGNKPVMAKAAVREPAPVVLKEQKIIANVDKDGFLTPPTTSGWFIGINGGFAKSHNRTMFINNLQDIEPPFNLDTYMVRPNNTQGMLGGSAGYRRSRETTWLPVIALSFRYNHLYSKNIGGDILLNSLEEFRDYNYDLNMLSNTYMAVAKLDVRRFDRLLPYVSAGIGAAYNRLQGYMERPLSQVITPRDNPPDFANNTNTEFTYSFGAGIDYQLTPLLTVSVGYEYQNYGNFQTGSGTGFWAGQHLQQRSFHTNSLLLSMDYVFAD